MTLAWLGIFIIVWVVTVLIYGFEHGFGLSR